MTMVSALDDITHGLPSLQFGVQLHESELSLLHLRKRSYELLLHAVSQSTYIVGMLNALHNYALTGDIVRPGSLPKNRINVGVVGGGRLCRHIISTLVHHAVCAPHDITVSTYQPSTLEDLVKKGVNVCADNRMVICQSDVVFLCIPSSQLMVLRRDVKFSPSNFLVAYVATLSKTDVVQQLCHSNILKADYTFNSDVAYTHSEPYQSLALALEDEDVVNRLFPGRELAYVVSSSDWIRDLVLVFYRHLMKLYGEHEKALDSLNLVLFGQQEDCYLTPRDFRIMGGKNCIATLPEHLTDLSDVGAKMVHLNEKLTSEKLLGLLFLKFKSFFKVRPG